MPEKMINSIEEVFTLLVKQYGQGIFKEDRKFLGLLSDYAPTLVKERKLIKIAVESGAYREICETVGSKRQYVVKKYLSILSDSYFIDKEWAQKSLLWCVQSLGSAEKQSYNSVSAVRETEVEKERKHVEELWRNPKSKLTGLSRDEVSSKLKTFSNEDLMMENFLLLKSERKARKAQETVSLPALHSPSASDSCSSSPSLSTKSPAVKCQPLNE